MWWCPFLASSPTYILPSHLLQFPLASIYYLVSDFQAESLCLTTEQSSGPAFPEFPLLSLPRRQDSHLQRLRTMRLFPPRGSETALTVKPSLGTWHAIQLTVPLRIHWVKFRRIKIVFWTLFSSSGHTRAAPEPAHPNVGKQKKNLGRQEEYRIAVIASNPTPFFVIPIPETCSKVCPLYHLYNQMKHTFTQVSQPSSPALSSPRFIARCFNCSL